MIPFGPDYSTGWSNTFCSLEVETRRTSLSISLSLNSFERERERWTLIWGVCVFFSFIVLKLLPFPPFIHHPVVLIKDMSLTPNFLLLLFLTLWLAFCRRRSSSFLSIFSLPRPRKAKSSQATWTTRRRYIKASRKWFPPMKFWKLFSAYSDPLCLSWCQEILDLHVREPEAVLLLYSPWQHWQISNLRRRWWKMKNSLKN